MADVITRFKLETTQYDSKLRNASKELAEYGRRAQAAGNEFQKFTQKNADAARALGGIATSANNAKDKVKELVAAYNDASKAYNALTLEQQRSDWGKGLAQSLITLKDRIRDAKNELYNLGDAMKGGGLKDIMNGVAGKFGLSASMFTGAGMAVAAAGGVAKLSEHIADITKESMQLAVQSEGVRMAFERLNRPDILDDLRKATHGTVSDLELMKAAVKFSDFKLSLDELSTMLAFAQQKAKDTGQSVDYMVESIVTGLGRKSVMILDNLGLSAAEIRDRMKETGDMTTAVGAIIREQMAASGQYIETAADKAKQAEVALKNAMEEFGANMQKLVGVGSIDELSTKIETELVGTLNFTAETIGKAKDASDELLTSFNDLVLNNPFTTIAATITGLLGPLQLVNTTVNSIRGGSGGSSGGGGSWLSRLTSNAASRLHDAQLPRYTETRDANGNLIRATRNGVDVTDEILKEENKNKNGGGGGGGGSTKSSPVAVAAFMPAEGSLPYLQNQLKAAQTLQSLAPNISEFDSWSMIIEELTRQIQVFKGEYKEVFTPSGPEEGSIDYQIQKVQELTAAWRAATNDTSRLVYAEQMKEQQAILDKMQGKVTTKPTETPRGYKETLGDVQQLTSSVNSIAGSLEKIGVEIPKGFSDVLGGMQAVITILEAIQTIQTVGSILGIFRNSGIVPHAARGMVIPGNDFADRTPVLASAGELILNRAAQGNIAAQLTSGGVGSANTTPYVDGEKIYLGLRNFLLRSGRGEIVTSRR